MKVTHASIKDVLIIEPDVFNDNRGYFMETFHQDRYLRCGIDSRFIQDNLSFSIQGTLRGLHFQINHPQAKLVQVFAGEIFDVAVDLRQNSPTYGQWTGIRLSAENHRQMYIPKGFAHGFCVMSQQALFAYKCSDFYAPDDEGGILWSDPNIDIHWPVENPIISAKDRKLPMLSELSPDLLPRKGQ